MKMGNLTDGMNPRIRPARTDDPALHAGHPADGLLEELLDGKPVFLALPAAIRGAVIFNDQLDISHLFTFRDSTDVIRISRRLVQNRSEIVRSARMDPKNNQQ